MAELHAKNIVEYLEEQRQKETLRFITCGSVDDGKSTLIGRLLYESKCIFDDQLKALETESKRYGTQGEKIDFALLVDGLEAEREQGITIDVASDFSLPIAVDTSLQIPQTMNNTHEIWQQAHPPRKWLFCLSILEKGFFRKRVGTIAL